MAMKYGYEEGETCNRTGCTGEIKFNDSTCCCSTTSMPPCSACENSYLLCDECGWEVTEEYLPKYVTIQGYEILEPEDNNIEVDNKTFKNLTL